MSLSSFSRSWAVGAGLAPPDSPSCVRENDVRPHVIPGEARPPSPRAPSPSVIPSEARILRPAWFYGARNLSYGFSGGFSVGGTDFAEGVIGFAAAGFPTVKYLRIFSSRFSPSPRIASKSSTLLNGPYDLRICRIFSAVAGPIPGTCCNSSEVAVLRFTGLAGGFFFAGKIAAQKMRFRKRKEKKTRTGNNRGVMARP